MRFDAGPDDDDLLQATCVRCGARRDVPTAGRGRMPAVGESAEDGVTVTADTSCRCGANRVRIKLHLDEL